MRITSAVRCVAQASISQDPEGKEHHLLVIKRSYDLPNDGAPAVPSRTIEPLILADRYRGDAATTSVSAACDFAFRKPLVDVVVLGDAISKRGPVTEMLVRLAVGRRIDKRIRVVGDRVWERSFFAGFKASAPASFVRMPVIPERAFGGIDTAHESPKKHLFHRRNLVGQGAVAVVNADNLRERRPPNLEPPGQKVSVAGDRVDTVFFSFVAPQWQPRVDLAGTYDDAWLESRFPLVPLDYDERFQQSAPGDQQLESLEAGTLIEIEGMNEDGKLAFRLPDLSLPVALLARGRTITRHEARFDTVVIEPNTRRMSVTWRVSTPVAGKLYDLRQAVIGEKSLRWFAMQTSHKPRYMGIGELVLAKSR